MDRTEMQGFYADEAAIDRESHLIFVYAIETAGDPQVAAAALAKEQSTAQWRRPGVDEDLRTEFAAKVVSVEEVERTDVGAFGARADGQGFTRARVRIAHPHRNFGARIPNLLTAAMGEGAFFCPGVASIKLMDIEFPGEYLSRFEGPRLGTQGMREMLGVFDRPLFFGVVKPNVGLDPESFAAIAKEAWLGGLDVAKDDEMLADPDYSPLAERASLVGRARIEAEQLTGEAKMFIANITDEVARICELAETAVAAGVNAVMLNVMAVGLSAVRMLRERVDVPIVAHFDCIAPMSRHPHFGVSSALITKLQRLCGCDAIIMPGFGERMMTSDEEVLANAAACSQSLGALKSALPVPGGSDWAGTLAQMYEKLRTPDFAMVPGRGVFGHPDGPRAGAASLRQAWDAIASRTDIGTFAEHCPELRRAIEAFGDAKPADGDVSAPAYAVKGFTGVPIIFQRS